MFTHPKALSFKASASSIAVSLLMASSLGVSIPAFATAADPGMTTPPVFSVSGNTLTLSQESVWTDGSLRTIDPGTFVQQAYVCGNPIANAGTGFVGSAFRDRILDMELCSRLASNQSGTTPFSSGDMTNIYYDLSGGFGTLLSGRNRFNHITVVSSVVSSGNILYAYAPTVPFTYNLVAPTLVTHPSNSISGSILTFSMGAWSNGTPSALVRVCSSAKIALTTPASAFLNGCIPVYETASPGPISGNPIDLTTAYIFGGMSGSQRYVDFIASAGNASYVHFIALSDAWFNNNPYYVYPASVEYVPSGSSPSQPQAGPAATTYTGPIVQAPGAVKPVASGSKVVLDGSNLTGVSKITIDGKDAEVKVNSDGELEITVPAGLAKGTYDLVVTSDSGVLTVQDGIRVDGSAGATESTESTAKPSTRLKEDDTVKVYVFNVVGAGKVQVMHNGKEVAWINTDDPDDAKILNDYLVRTLELLNGKNIIEIFVNGVRIDRKAYTKVNID